MSFNLPDGCTDAQIDSSFSADVPHICDYCQNFLQAGYSGAGLCAVRYEVGMSAEEVANVCIMDPDLSCDRWEEFTG